MDKCKSCEHYDAEKSNDNWVACRGTNMPLEVILSRTSEHCGNYVWVKPQQPTAKAPDAP